MKIQVLATDKCMSSGIFGLLDVFFAANYCVTQRYDKGSIAPFDCQIVTINNKPVTAYNGIQVIPTEEISNSVLPDVVITSFSAEIVIDCCDHEVNIANKDDIFNWLRLCHNQGSIIASYCTGSFLLAAVGLLNGKSATTHWRSADLFRQTFPFVRLASDQLIVDNGDVICAGGSISYIDLALHLIDKHLGRDITSDCAKLLVFDPVRQKQSPYVSFQSQKGHEDQAILNAQEWLERHFKKEIIIDELAEKVGLSSRTFKRRFKNATNENPLNYLQRIRVEHVKDKLEKTTENINNIIWSVGYEDISSFRQLFKRFTGLTPRDYRQKFS